MKTGLLYDENDTPLRWEEIPAKYIDAANAYSAYVPSALGE